MCMYACCIHAVFLVMVIIIIGIGIMIFLIYILDVVIPEKKSISICFASLVNDAEKEELLLRTLEKYM